MAQGMFALPFIEMKSQRWCRLGMKTTCVALIAHSYWGRGLSRDGRQRWRGERRKGRDGKHSSGRDVVELLGAKHS